MVFTSHPRGARGVLLTHPVQAELAILGEKPEKVLRLKTSTHPKTGGARGRPRLEGQRERASSEPVLYTPNQVPDHRCRRRGASRPRPAPPRAVFGWSRENNSFSSDSVLFQAGSTFTHPNNGAAQLSISKTVPPGASFGNRNRNPVEGGEGEQQLRSRVCGRGGGGASVLFGWSERCESRKTQCVS
jgi:hypothetical protein